MPLTGLIAVTHPPRDPVEGRGDWAAVERRLGLALPRDFKALIGTYGSGSFADFLNPINPLRGDGAGVEWMDRKILDGDREIRRDFPWAMPYPIHPEPGGILPWATTDNGDVLYWRTRGDPDTWTVLVRESRGDVRVEYPFGAAEFLRQWLSGELTCPVFPSWDVRAVPGFSPVRALRTFTVYFAHADGTFDERLARLREHLGAVGVGRESPDQSVFRAEPSDARVTYTELGGGYGAWLAIAFPPDDERHYRELVARIPADLGWPIRRIFEPKA